MADSQSNARPRAEAGAPTSGVIHVRTRLTAHFTVIANALAQRPGSAVTVGVAAYILSLPDGARVSVAALCAHFTEGEILISRALRELEGAGYLERRRVRGANGLIHTRTYFYDVPGQGDRPTPPPRPRKPSTAEEMPAPSVAGTPATDAEAGSASTGDAQAAPATAPGDGSAPESGASTAAAAASSAPESVEAGCGTAAPDSAVAPPPLSLDDADPQAVVILASLRIVNPRLILSRREVAELAPAVTEWLARGVGAEEITRALTLDLPDPLRARPSRILAYRLGEQPIAVPATSHPATPPDRPNALPWQTCEGGCERAFRAARPGSCRECRDCDGSPDIDESTRAESIGTMRAALRGAKDRQAA
ncbi:hypothetical protein OH809_25950 [Streptomyces sp. NBC_00873]|uniref:hypothetical protein n=1 Tax=unclassified Streptomyces TaxID=2593676 RepID=UPI00386635C2|nr:hypothetical protein OH809_25950 [Streptomyces sp. NBC_00873]WTA44289.1 hypothetical protein OH821_18020 [Streptomyces sp. NBC_00842]